MSNLNRRIILGLLFLIVSGVVAPIGFQSELLAWDVALKAGDFAPGQLEAHYLKHGYQFGQISQAQYLEGARALLDAVPGSDVLEKIKPANGDIERFRVSTGEFAVMTRRGRIRTYYKSNYWYWIRH